MPITYERDDDRRRIVVTVVGTVTLQEFLGILECQATEGTWRYGLLYIADRLEPPSTVDLRTMVTHVQRLIIQHGPRGPVAIVSDTVAIYGIARTYALLSERLPQDLAVFRTAGDADRWLTGQPFPTETASPARGLKQSVERVPATHFG